MATKRFVVSESIDVPYIIAVVGFEWTSGDVAVATTRNGGVSMSEAY